MTASIRIFWCWRNYWETTALVPRVRKKVMSFNHWLQLRLQPLSHIFYAQRNNSGVVGGFLLAKKIPSVNAAQCTTNVCSGLWPLRRGWSLHWYRSVLSQRAVGALDSTAPLCPAPSTCTGVDCARFRLSWNHCLNRWANKGRQDVVLQF